MVREKLVVKVNMERDALYLADNEGILGTFKFSKVSPGKRGAIPGTIHPKFEDKHKIVTLQYLIYPIDLRDETTDEVPSEVLIDRVENHFNTDREATMAYDLDKYNLQRFISNNCAQDRLDVQAGVQGNYWLLNLRVENPSEVHIIHHI